jgi:hypothetical protein
MILCAVLSAAVWYFARDLDLYTSEDNEDYDALELKELRRKRNPKITSRDATPAVRRRKFVPVASQGGGDVIVTRDNDWAEAQQGADLLDLSDHMEDSMEEPPYRPNRTVDGVY